MKSLHSYAILMLTISFLYACSTRRNTSEDNRKTGKPTITGVTPTIKNPSRGVINASGDGLTPGIGSSNGAGSEENATNIANNAISKANAAFRIPQQKFESLTDEDFLNRGFVSEMTEIKMSRLAQQKTSNKKIKNYASMILNDHQQIENELKKLSADKKIKLSDSINGGMQTIKTAANQLNSSTEDMERNFDLEYVQMMIAGHRNAVNLFEAGSKSKDPEIRAFAIKYLPMLRMHLSEAQELTTEVRPKR
jgi:putative membrane protein